MITLPLACGENFFCLAIKKSKNMLKMIVCKNFVWLLVSLSTTLFLKESHNLSKIYLLLLKMCPRQNFERFQY